MAVTNLGIVEETTTPVYTGTMVNERDVVIPGTTLHSLTLTHYDQVSGTIINNRNEMDVLQTNNVTINEQGVLTWILQPEDTVILDDTVTLETHIALFAWRWQGGARYGKHEIRYQVRNLVRVP